jgi:hypothetical protein
MEYVYTSPEEDAFATALVDEALADYKDTLPPEVYEEIRSYLIDELTITSYGVDTLRRLGMTPMVDRSAEILQRGAVLETLKKHGSST